MEDGRSGGFGTSVLGGKKSRTKHPERKTPSGKLFAPIAIRLPVYLPSQKYVTHRYVCDPSPLGVERRWCRGDLTQEVLFTSSFEVRHGKKSTFLEVGK